MLERSLEELGYITVEAAETANDRIFGLMLLVMVAIACAAWVAVCTYVRREKRLAKLAQNRAEKRLRKEFERKLTAQGGRHFAEIMQHKEREKALEYEITARDEMIADLQKKYNDLKTVAESCPAYGTRGQL